MNVANKTLSICIPTFNRSHLLKEGLAYILAAAKGYENKIEIVISDNASTDSTRDVVREFQIKYPFIRYHRNDVNIFELNYYVAAGLAKGEYIWLFSDDDKMNTEAISMVLRSIESGYNLIIINYSLWTNDFSKMIKPKVFPLRKDMIFFDHNVLMNTFGLRLGFISCIVVKKDRFCSLPEEEYKPYREYGFPFLYSIYYAVLNQCRAYFITKPLLAQRGCHTNVDISWWYKYFVTGSSLIFQELQKKGYSENAIHHAKHLVLKNDVLHDISYRKGNSKSLEGIFRLMLPLYKRYWFFWIVIVPMLISPRILIVFANKCVVLVRKLKFI